MRILHTADWHAGKPLQRLDRLDELASVLAEITDLAIQEQVDCVLMTGDVFDQKVPPAEAEAVVYTALLALERHGIHVVIISGNHDSPSRWRALRPLFTRFHIHVVPEVTRPDQGGIVTIPARDGAPALQVAALPWVPLRKIVDAAALMDPTTPPYSKYADGVGSLMRALCKTLRPDLCTVFAGHLTVNGAVAGGGERTLTLGDVYAIDPQSFPQVQYVALGHIHRPQGVKQTAIPARYCGSPMQLDFGEVGYQTSVTLVDLTPGLPAQIREVPLTAGRRLLDAHGTLEELEARREEFGDAFLRVTLTCPKPLPDLGDQVRALLPNAMEIRLDYPRATTTDAVSVRMLTHREQFARYLHERYETTPDAADLDLFDQLLEEVSGGHA